MRTNPHILEISAISWLTELEKKFNAKLTLADIPESVLFSFKEKGFDAIWLMGVWQESPSSREIARAHPDINNRLKKVCPDYKKEDISGSPYSIYGYQVNDILGGNEALLQFKERLNDFGILLLLDFAGNHLAIDHPLTLTHPEYFIKSDTEPKDKDLFFKTQNGVWIAHGKDPHFPSWTDTAQINHFNPAAREFLLKTLIEVSKLCDGVRCDMSMLMINKIFKETWGTYAGFAEPAEEFWPKAIHKVKELNPYFIFMAEVYWGLEWEIQQMGFDFTYDKTLYDRLVLSTPQNIRGHLRAEHLYQMRSIRFIANHDEETPIAVFGRQKSRAAAAVAYTIPGARLFTLAQIYGEPYRLPIQYLHSLCATDKDTFEFYDKFLTIINHPCFHGGQWVMKTSHPATAEDNSCDNVLSWYWTQLSMLKIVAVNYSDKTTRCMMPIDKVPPTETIFIKEEFSDSGMHISAQETKKNGIFLELKPFEIKIFSVDF